MVNLDIPVFSDLNGYIANYQKIAKDHSDHFHAKGENPFIQEEIWQEMEDSTALLIKKYAQKGAKILDVGVGMGRLLRQFPDLDRYGMDISFDYLKISRSHGINVCFSMIEDMPYQTDFFDIVVCTDVLEHVFDLYICTQKILSVLKPGGILILRVPYRENLTPYLDESLPYTYVHLRNFDKASLRLHFEKIFSLSMLEENEVLFLHSLDRLKYKFPILDRLFLKFLSVLRRFFSRIYNQIRKRFFYGVEINMAFKKSDKD